MNATTTGIEFDKQIVNMFSNAIDEGMKQSARMIWSIATTFVAEHWLFVIGAFLCLLVFFVIRAIVGEWGALYSLTYWTLYTGVIYVIGLIWGPEALVSDIFHIMYILAIWPVCYFVTGWIWNRFGFRRKRL